MMDHPGEESEPYTVYVTSGDPSGIGPDICVQYAQRAVAPKDPIRVIFLGDPCVFEKRAAALGLPLRVMTGTQSQSGTGHTPHALAVIPYTFPVPVIAGAADIRNTHTVLEMLRSAVQLTAEHAENCVLVTAPLHKGLIHQAGLPFVDHTQWLKQYFQCDQVLTLMVNSQMRVAFMTTHIALREVPNALSQESIAQALLLLAKSLRQDFSLRSLRIAVTGLNPHAGDNGLAGAEEIDFIIPAIRQIKETGLQIEGPFSADSIFLNYAPYDAILVMYHDQGLPAFKMQSCHSGVNVTLGLPIVRTSVDHGTAFDIAGSGKSTDTSLAHAIELAVAISKNRYHSAATAQGNLAS